MVRIELPGTPRTPARLLAVLVGMVILALGAVAWHSRRSMHAVAGIGSDELLERIAALDARYAGREGETSPDEWSSYRTERARLKVSLEASLAEGGRGR